MEIKLDTLKIEELYYNRTQEKCILQLSQAPFSFSDAGFAVLVDSPTLLSVVPKRKSLIQMTTLKQLRKTLIDVWKTLRSIYSWHILRLQISLGSFQKLILQFTKKSRLYNKYPGHETMIQIRSAIIPSKGNEGSKTHFLVYNIELSISKKYLQYIKS